MKKVIFFILCLFCFSVKAQELNISNEIIRFDKIDNFDLQGFTVTDKYIFAILINDDDTKSIVKVFDLNTYEEVYSFTSNSLGHANDVTYNDKTNIVYVLQNGSSVIHMFDADNFVYIGDVETELPIRSITYIPDRDAYAVRVISSAYYLDKDFKLINNKPFIFGMDFKLDSCRQGWAYHDGKLFYATWSWIRKGGDGSSKLTVYNTSGKKIDQFVTDSHLGELEDIAFTNDKMILGFNGYDDYVAFYLEDIPKVEEKPIKKAKDETKDDKDTRILVERIVGTGILVVLLIFNIWVNRKQLKKRLK